MTRILILTAMKEELKDVAGLPATPTTSLAPFAVPVWKLQRNEAEILIAETGIGPINASSVLTSFLSNHKFDVVLLLGLGGAVDPALKLGDVCIATDVIQHDAVCSSDHGLEYMASGELHLSLPKEKRKPLKIKASTHWNQKIDSLLKNQPGTVHHGIVLSGSEFVGGTVRKSLLKRTFADALLVDMEACSVAYLCEKAQVPFVIAKTVADTTQSKPTEEYVNFLTSSQKKTADIIDGLLA
ncbi:5'-methylthioadenosine/S-adenosylhomocysteine nucleosidase [Bdellovibrio bacteriovorus]|uniref:5'-methylthioadenosine/S-adenosylhomocysteine nucleosidase n=1 Tax=Bdellovibrio bacteriovorus TaxID=959 RepID=UPI00045BFCEA|nr:5'-methylthioadenosine/S-adenosylhomocysteine nucleosidase [Bdellovibrio bacteriovorus]AHZ85147.1 5'-methylthioadenosine nucleosidase [Bdellovibrio bacteriovorus]BEV69037.1 5'-methylthioadenosine/S-adenosylhomocysteine nucleosidase [Bdellovibrio bacteriovorus]